MTSKAVVTSRTLVPSTSPRRLSPNRQKRMLTSLSYQCWTRTAWDFIICEYLPNGGNMSGSRFAAIFALILIVAPAFAQVDFSGEWAPRFYVDQPISAYFIYVVRFT